jgi:hypothetical protein
VNVHVEEEMMGAEGVLLSAGAEADGVTVEMKVVALAMLRSE